MSERPRKEKEKRRHLISGKGLPQKISRVEWGGRLEAVSDLHGGAADGFHQGAARGVGQRLYALQKLALVAAGDEAWRSEEKDE
jgi:hypothetical protein